MKKFLLLLLFCILTLNGCTDKAEPVATIPQASPETTHELVIEPDITETTVEDIAEATNTDLLCVSVPASTEHYALEDGTELFSYTAQHMQLLLPNDEVADKVILNFLNRVDAARMDAENVMVAAQNDYEADSTWYPYFYQILYSPTRIDHNVLSLFGTQNSYSGSTHGSLSCVTANYDLSTGDVLTLGSILHMDADKNDIIDAVIQKLGEHVSEYQLFDGYEEGVYNRLGGDENLYEDFYFTTSGLSFFFTPYEIAPYSAGIITVEIPYQELTGILYDGYFPAERDQSEGTIYTGSFMETDMEQFDNMAEVTLDAGEEILVVYPEGTVEDVRVSIADNGKNLSSYTVFAALEMSANNAVVLSVSEEVMNNTTIAYISNDELFQIPLA